MSEEQVKEEELVDEIVGNYRMEVLYILSNAENYWTRDLRKSTSRNQSDNGRESNI
jgi:hypothetical protein